jgi:hypothetical protein
VPEQRLPLRLTADGLEVYGSALGTACTQCGARDGEVSMIGLFEGSPPEPLHDRCAIDRFFARGRELAEVHQRALHKGP